MAKGKYISDLTTDELLAMVNRLSWGVNILDFLPASITKTDPVMKGYRATIIELKKRRGYKTDKEVIEATNEWRSEQYRKKYDDSYCAKCPASPGKEQFVQDRFHLPMHCMSAIDDFNLLMNCDFPKKKEDCHYARTLDSKCEE